MSETQTPGPELTGTTCLACGSKNVTNRSRRFAGFIPGNDKRANPHLEATADQFIRRENVVDVCLDCGNHMSYQVQTIAELPPNDEGFSRDETGRITAAANREANLEREKQTIEAGDVGDVSEVLGPD